MGISLPAKISGENTRPWNKERVAIMDSLDRGGLQ